MARIIEGLLDTLQYRDIHLQRPRHFFRHVGNEGLIGVGGDMDYAGARWENVQGLLRRASDFDSRCMCEGVVPAMHRFLRLCNAYAPRELEYRRNRADNEVTICTMHYALG